MVPSRTKSRPTRGHGLLEKFLAEERASMANRLINPAHKTGCILDLGGGSYPAFLENTEFRKKIWLDKFADSSVLAAATDITCVQWDIESDVGLPIDTASCNVVTMLAVLEHVSPQRIPSLLKDIHRTLRPDGQLILTTPAAWADSLLRSLAKINLVSADEIEDHKSFFSAGSLLDLLKEFFPAKGVTVGHFEAFMNLWANAKKGL